MNPLIAHYLQNYLTTNYIDIIPKFSNKIGISYSIKNEFLIFSEVKIFKTQPHTTTPHRIKKKRLLISKNHPK